MTDPFAVLRHDAVDGGPRWLAFASALEVVSCRAVDEVPKALEIVDAWWQQGHWVVGMLTYEAAPAFDDALVAHSPGAMPVAWWARCAPPTVHHGSPPLTAHQNTLPSLDWQPILARSAYGRAIAEIHRYIAAGDTYQVNYTFPLVADYPGHGSDLFLALHRAQPTAAHGAYLDLGRFVVCSVSPELFFSLDGHRLLTRPMKGTAARGRYPAEDQRRIQDLGKSDKDRAENVMIVDMMRNDLGKVARPGSVRVEDLFRIESHPTVHQLTSTVSAESDASLPQILAALFPCASITGAPKVRTMEIIRRLEIAPRGIYTGSLGWLAPATARTPRRAHFNVAIRTATVDRRNRQVRFGTGGGIVWDSRADTEYEECRTKARILQATPPPFDLLETLRWHPERGYRHFRYHWQRLQASARYFAFDIDPDVLRRQLLQPPAATELSSSGAQRVRWQVRRDGTFRRQWFAFTHLPRRPWSVVLDDRPVHADNPFLFHKTTHRRVYEDAAGRHPEADEVLLWNTRGELTEGLRTNVAILRDGRWLTPPVECGLLAGVQRQRLLERGRLEEAVLPVEALQTAEAVVLINSLRGLIRALFEPARGKNR